LAAGCGSASRQTDFVMAGGETGSKLNKAHTLGVKIIEQKEFPRLCTE